MTDLTPEQDAVRRLLAEARHDEPTPPEVVARLTRTLEGLQAERHDVADRAPVVDLASRRRRLVGVGVLAAAAVVVAGVALGQALPQGSSDGGGSDSAASAEDGTTMDSRAGDGEAESSPEELSDSAAVAQVLPEISLDSDLDSSLSSLRTTSRSPSSASSGGALVACQVGEVGRGRQVLVQVDGKPGLVVFGSVVGSGQEANVYLCGDAEPVRTLTLPAP